MKNNKTIKGKGASVGRSFPFGFVYFSPSGAIRFNPCRSSPKPVSLRKHPNLSASASDRVFHLIEFQYN